MVRIALAAKTPSRVMAITDATAGAGLPPGSRAALGGRTITVREAAYLDDGTIAGSVLTMDRAFALLVSVMGQSLRDHLFDYPGPRLGPRAGSSPPAPWPT
jgi:N-acetylglucosamine-6-phosphate deacetylase